MGQVKIVSLGEVMLRLSPPGFQRLTQAGHFEFMYSGAEANVLISLARWGWETSFVTRVPATELGEACLMQLRSHGLSVQHVQRGGSRLGIYFVENGASQRPATVIYDRQHSAISEIDPQSLDWSAIFQGAQVFHVTGITPALSASAAQATIDGVREAKKRGLTVTCDLNYRAKLWDRASAAKALDLILPHVDVCLGVEPLVEIQRSPDPEKNKANVVLAAQDLCRRYPLRAVSITLREEHSATHNGWSGFLYAEGQAYWSRHYDMQVIERVGSGDSFTAGLIYGLVEKLPYQEVIEFATAASCLKHTIPGDFNLVTKQEIQALINEEGYARIQR